MRQCVICEAVIPRFKPEMPGVRWHSKKTCGPECSDSLRKENLALAATKYRLNAKAKKVKERPYEQGFWGWFGDE